MSATDVGSSIPYQRFDTTGEVAGRRLDAFREAMSPMYEVQPLDEVARQAPVVLHVFQLGSGLLLSAELSAYSYERSPQMIARDGRDLYQIQLYQAGRCHIVRGGQEATATPGDILVTDLAHPIFTHEPAFRHVDLLLPRALLAPLLRDPDAHGGHILSGRNPLVALVGNHLSSLLQQAPRLPPAHAIEVLTATAQLVASALNHYVDEQTVSGVRVALGCELRRFIRQHLDDRDLSPERLAQRFGISRATVYRLFQAEQGVARYVQGRRLARARIQLSSSAHRHRTIAEIGEVAGYAHAQDFVRAFRREYGIRPGELREQTRASGRLRLLRSAPDLPIWSEWVRGM